MHVYSKNVSAVAMTTALNKKDLFAICQLVRPLLLMNVCHKQPAENEIKAHSVERGVLVIWTKPINEQNNLLGTSNNISQHTNVFPSGNTTEVKEVLIKE